ncbi:hypothetical protein V8C40DRAFT_263095 [Trichoderma camerunense]
MSSVKLQEIVAIDLVIIGAVRQKLQVGIADRLESLGLLCATVIVLDIHTRTKSDKFGRQLHISSRYTDRRTHHRDHIADDTDEMELSWSPSRGDFFAEASSRSFPFTFGGYFSKPASTKPSKEEWVKDIGNEIFPQQSKRPRRTLANAHMPPPYDSGDDGDDEHDDDDDENDENRFAVDIERYCIDFSDYVFNGVVDRIDPLVLDHASPCLSTTRQSSSSLNPVHDGQISLQDATFSAYFQTLNARIQSGKRGESCLHEQSQPVLRTEDENIESNKESRGQKDHNQGNELGDCVMVEGEESEDEDEMTDSCLNVMDHLDYVMFPTAEVLEFVRGGEMEVLEDVDDGEAACRRFLGEEQYDEEENKELGREELENRGRRWFRCGVFSKDVTRRLHRLRYGC